MTPEGCSALGHRSIMVPHSRAGIDRNHDQSHGELSGTHQNISLNV